MKSNNPYALENRPFNMAVMFLERLDRRLDERDTSSNIGDLLGWYRRLRTIYRNVHFKVIEQGHEEKEEELEQKFEKLKNLLKSSTIITGNKQLNQQISGNALTETEILLHDTDLILNDLLYEYEFIFPKNLKKPLEEHLEEDFTGD